LDANWIEVVTDLAVGFVTRDAVRVLHLMLLQYSNVLYCTGEANTSAWDIERRAACIYFSSILETLTFIILHTASTLVLASGSMVVVICLYRRVRIVLKSKFPLCLTSPYLGVGCGGMALCFQYHDVT
jgi:hypothetical protein